MPPRGDAAGYAANKPAQTSGRGPKTPQPRLTGDKLADFALCLLLVRLSGVPPRLEAAIRRDPRGRHRDITTEGFLTLVTFSLVQYGSARTSRLWACLRDQELNSAWRLTGLHDANGQPVSIYKLRRMYAIVEQGLRVSRLRPARRETARRIERLPLTDAELAANLQLLEELVRDLLLGWAPPVFPTGAIVAFDGTGLETWTRPLAKKLRKQLENEGSRDLLLETERKLPRKQQAALRRARSLRAVEGRFGHQTPTRSHPKTTFGGCTLHTCVFVEAPHTPPVPRLICRALLSRGRVRRRHGWVS